MLHAGALLLAPAMVGAIDLSLVPEQSVVNVGDTVRIGLYATSDSGDDHLFAAMDVIFGWDFSHLMLLGTDQTGAVPLLSAGLPAGDPYGLNEASPPADGDALFTAYAPFSGDTYATTAGTLITTIEFEATAGGFDVPIDILPTAGSPMAETTVFDGTIPNFDVTGMLFGTTVTILVPGPGALGVLGLGLLGLRGRRRREDGTGRS